MSGDKGRGVRALAAAQTPGGQQQRDVVILKTRAHPCLLFTGPLMRRTKLLQGSREQSVLMYYFRMRFRTA
jgi:hypothetical protein